MLCDHRLADAEAGLVDPVPDGLEGPLDRVALEALNLRRRNGEVEIDVVPFDPARGNLHVGHLLRDEVVELLPLVALDDHFDAVRLLVEAHEPDAFPDHPVLELLHVPVDHVVHHLGRIELIEKTHASLQVEAEVNLLGREVFLPLPRQLYEIGQEKDNGDEKEHKYKNCPESQ